METGQRLCLILSIIAILLSTISIVISVKCSCLSGQAQKQLNFLKKIQSLRYEFFHSVIVVALTVYVLVNWNKCVSMQFFQRFDGNNILFIVWILSLFLILYKIKLKDFEVVERVHELKKEFSDEDMKYQIQQRENLRQETEKRDGLEGSGSSEKEASSDGPEN